MHNIELYDYMGLIRDLRKMLRLEDWDICVELVDIEQVKKDEISLSSRAYIIINYAHKEAIIRINKDHQEASIPYDAGREIMLGWLFPVVHELCHLHLYGFARFSEKIIDNHVPAKAQDLCYAELSAYEERVVNMFTKSMINALGGGSFVEKYYRGDNHDEVKDA